jgi:hypothetical protein
MLRKRADTDALHRGDRVVAVVAMPDVPEGTQGTVKMVVGQAWTRYLVKWDTGEWMGTVDGSKIVRDDRLDLYKTRKAEEAERAALVAIAPTEAAPAVAAEGGDSRVPAHLLERSRAARARAGTKAEAS